MPDWAQDTRSQQQPGVWLNNFQRNLTGTIIAPQQNTLLSSGFLPGLVQIIGTLCPMLAPSVGVSVGAGLGCSPLQQAGGGGWLGAG